MSTGAELNHEEHEEHEAILLILLPVNRSTGEEV